MKQAIPYLIAEIVLSLMVTLLVKPGSADFLAILGLVNLILGVLGLLTGTFFSIVKEKNISKGLLISSSLLLLMGFFTCSVFYLK